MTFNNLFLFDVLAMFALAFVWMPGFWLAFAIFLALAAYGLKAGHIPLSWLGDD